MVIGTFFASARAVGFCKSRAIVLPGGKVGEASSMLRTVTCKSISPPISDGGRQSEKRRPSGQMHLQQALRQSQD